MGALEQIQSLYEYNEWANNHVLQAASGLTEEELAREMGASFGSIQGNLVHTVGAQIMWLARWAPPSGPIGMPQLQAGHVMEAIREAYANSHEGLRAFAASLGPEDLDTAVSYVDSRGQRLERPLGQIMLHLANHGTHHRAETAMLLTALGTPLPQLDYLFFEELERA
jgi:uncharacterized damage-inducible protein DinB